MDCWKMQFPNLLYHAPLEVPAICSLRTGSLVRRGMQGRWVREGLVNVVYFSFPKIKITADVRS